MSVVCGHCDGLLQAIDSIACAQVFGFGRQFGITVLWALKFHGLYPFATEQKEHFKVRSFLLNCSVTAVLLSWLPQKQPVGIAFTSLRDFHSSKTTGHLFRNWLYSSEGSMAGIEHSAGSVQHVVKDAHIGTESPC